VLSGFLITSIILKNLHKSNFLIAFYGRRALRIWPIYYISLFSLILFNLVSPRPEPLDALPFFLTYTQNIQEYWFGIAPPFIHGFQHTWTLAIEENFYLFWPLLIYGFGQRSVLPLSVGVVAVSVVARGRGFGHFILLTQADGLGLGSLLAVIFSDSPNRFNSRKAQLSIVFICQALFSVGFAMIGTRLIAMTGACSKTWAASFKLFSINLFFCAVVGLIYIQAGRPWLKPLRWRVLVYLGEISYGLYLYHYMIFCSVRVLMESAGMELSWISNTTIFAASICTAACSWKWIEGPILWYKSYFIYEVAKIPINKQTITNQ